MDFRLKNMYKIFKDEIWKELEPLDHNWFEILTAQTSANEGSSFDQDELCANQEGHFKTPLDKTAVGSQLFSTPKVFRHSRIVSPEIEDEQPFSTAQEKDTLPWMETQSPYLFQMSKRGVPGTKYEEIQPQSQDSFDQLDTPHKSPMSYAKHISESLGAQINPDISWTSSLNTPPPVPSTLILSKIDESPCPVSVSAEKSVVFVRKLFPSLSNPSRIVVAPPKNDNIPTDNHDAVLPEVVSSQTLLTQSEGVWQQTLPGANEDGKICSTVASAPHEFQNASSTFLANSSSALRKVKPDRIRRKQFKLSEHDCSSTDISKTNRPDEEHKADEEHNTVPSSPSAKNGTTGISQWSPLNLSEIPPCTADNNILTELQTDFDSRQLVRPTIKITDTGFIRKKRKFVYTVETLKPKVQENETDFQKRNTSSGIPDTGPELSSKQSEDAPDEAGYCSNEKNAEQKQETITLENLPSSVQEKVQDFDMSQLHKDFAQDFSQISDSGKMTKEVAEDQNHFSPSACLLAMKKAKHQTKQASLHHDYNSISNTGHMSTTNQNYSTNEGTISDSGFQSAVADITHTASSCIVPCSENTGSKTDIHRTTPFPSTHRGNEKSQLKERRTMANEREGQLDMESTLTQLPSSLKGTDDGLNCIPLNGQVHGRLLEKTEVSLPSVHGSGFKTASNKGIQISLANLEKARHLFEERDGDQPTKCNSAAKHKNSQSNGSVKSRVSVSNQQPSISDRFEGVSCYLTASQKADVTELCTLLEEADSQFEFTQFRGAEVKQPCQENSCFLEKTDKDLDPDFLAGIDFDDSFSSDAEKHLAVTVMPDKMTYVVDEKANGGTSNITGKSASVLMSSIVKREKKSAGDILFSSENNSGGSNWLMSTKQKSLHRAEHSEASKMEKQKPLMFSVAFKTAGGNSLSVSKTCLSKARALFADLEMNVSDLNSSHKQAAETDAKTKEMCSVDSETATGDLKFTLKDNCHIEEKTWSCFSNTKQAVSAFKQARNMQDKDATKSFENCKTDAINISEEHGIVHTEFENVNTGLGRPHPDDIEMNSVACNTVLEFKNPVSFHETPFSTSKLLPCQASKSIDSSAISELSSGDGFCTASGKKVSVSADAMKKAKCLLNDTYTFEDASKKITQSENALRTAQLTAQKESLPKTSGFDTATGKGVSISSTAHKKAKCLLSECDKVDHKINLKPSHYKIPVYGSPPSNAGFLAASGKKIAFSSKALQKAKALFSDISFSADSPAGPHPKNSDEKNDNCEHPDKMQSGLTTGRENVHVSEKNILKDFEDSVLIKAMQETEDCNIDVNNGENIVHISGSGSDLGIRPDQRVTFKISVESANKQVKQKDSLPLQSGGFGPVSGKGVSVSSEVVKRVASSLEQCDKGNDKINLNQSHLKTSVYSPLPTSGGFHVASEKPLTLSSEALQKAKTLSSESISSAESPVVPRIKNFVKSGNGCTEDKNKQLKKKEASFPLQSGGFQTASGKGLAISSEALKKAKSLLGEFDELDDKSGKPSCSKTPVPENGGFLAASGKPVALSSEALQKAKTLFSDIISSAESPHAKNSNKNHDNCEPMAKMQSGFKTAGGEKVHISQKDLLNAKHLLKHFDDSVLTKATQMAEDCDMDVNNDISAKHKSVAPMIGTGSDEKNVPGTRLQQKVTLGFSVESGKRYTEDTDKQAERKSDTLLLQIASEKGVTIASEALRKARSLLGECDEVEDKIGINPSCSKIPIHDLFPQNGGFRAASGKPVALSSEALQRAKVLFGDISSSAEIPHAKNTHKKYDYGENTPKMQRSSTTVEGEKVHVSEQTLLKAKHLLKETDDCVSKKAMQEEDSFTKDCNMDINYEISVKRDISKDSENGCTEVTNERMKQKNTWPQKSIGFQTASGKGVAVSSEALKRAKTLLSECEGVEDKITITAPQAKISAHGPPFRNSGFLAASGKPVALSSEAMQKTKALFSDISQSRDTPAVAHTRKNNKKIDAHKREETHCGFRTVGGVKVHVSEKSILKATSLFKEFDDGDCHDSLLFSTSPQDNPMLNLSKVEDVERPSGSNLTTASDKYMSAKGTASLVVESVPSLQESDHKIANSRGHGCPSVNNKASKDAFKFQEDTITPSGAGILHDCPEEEMQCLLDYEINKESSTKEFKVLKPNDSSVLNFGSLNITGCTETQQEFLAQEALDCTKALLEDEGLAGQSLLMTLGNIPLQHNTNANGCEESEKRRGKRSAEDTEMNGQPPLKRRLLEEFDRTLMDPKASTLHPVKSCPNGLMKDRGVFKYGTSLYPNITQPHSGKNYVETRFPKTPQIQNSTTGEPRSKSAHYKTSAFVPPFVRNEKTETHKNTVLKDSIRTPSAFVPPFKKQRTIVQESSYKAHEEEDKHQKPFVMSSNSKCFVPPTKKTQGATDGTAVAAAQSDDMMNNPSLPVDFRSVSAVRETSGVDGTCSRSQDVYQNLQNTELARDMQDMRIRKKKRQNIRPLPGSLYLKKTSGLPRIPLKAAVNGKVPGKYTPKKLYEYGVQKCVSDISSENAESFRFNLLQFIKQEAFTDEGGVKLADGGWLVPSNDGTAGKEEFYRALCDTPGVDPKLISDAWVYNHYRWIVWKQSSMEKSFPEIVGSWCLTPELVLLQLKYRYDVEVDHSRRPALRKIMEKDDTAAKTLVLCVCEIVSRGHSLKIQSHNDTKTPHSVDAKVETSAALIWLTDGWYSIKAQLDEPLTAMVHKGRLAVGAKLIIHGAQLVGSQDACTPLEAPESLMFKICANSCRPARWDAKLGFHKDPRPFLLPISCLYSNGGPVGCVDIVVLRSYPMQWMERKPDGGVIFRSSRAEEKEARRYNSHKQKAMEILFAKIQSEFENEEKGNIKPQQRRKTISRQEIANLQDGEELYEAVGDDPAYLEAHLSAQQLEALHSYRRALMEKKQAELQDRYHRALEAEDNEMNCPKREVTPVWKLCIADSMVQPGRVYQLNLWRPSSDLQSLLKEGCRYKVYNLTTSDGKKRSCIEAVQLTGTNKTQFQELQASQEWLSAYFQPRVSTDFVNLQNPDFEPLCGEIDMSGYVISVVDGQGSSPAFYLADGKLNFVKVRCFSSLSQTGLEDVVKPRAILALSNLQLRGQSMHPTPVVYAGDLTGFSTNPKEVHLQESFSQLKTLVQCQENFFVTAEEKLSQLVKSNGLSSSSSPALHKQTPASLTDRRQDIKSNVISQKPGRNLGSFTPIGRNSPTPTSAEKDPKSLKRRRALDYLSRIASPPPLSHLGSVASPCVNKTFNPPRRSVTPSTLKTVQTPSHKPTDSLGELEWVNDEELAMIDTQALRVNLI